MFSVTILLSYILLGFTLAAPIGPVNSARIDKGIKNGFWHAWIVGFGSMLADGDTEHSSLPHPFLYMLCKRKR